MTRKRITLLRQLAYASPIVGLALAGLIGHGEPFRVALPILAVSIALASWLLNLAKGHSDAADARSKAYLDAVVAAYGEAESLVSPDDAGRIEWIGAARALLHAKRFSRQIDLEAHCEVLELRRTQARRVLHGALDRPAAFFYGVSPDMELDAAAEASTGTRTAHGRARLNFSLAIPETALHAVWEAAQWPDNYEDPLDTSFSDEEVEGRLFLFEGLRQYLVHQRIWVSSSGRLHRRQARST